MTLIEQFRAVFQGLWRVLRVNPLRVYPMVYYGLLGRFTKDETMRRRIEGWIADAEPKGSSRADKIAARVDPDHVDTWLDQTDAKDD